MQETRETMYDIIDINETESRASRRDRSRV